MAGQMPIPGGSIYTTSKYAVVGMSEVMKTDLARYDIGVSVLCPGGVITNVAKSGRNRPANLKRETDTSRLNLGKLSAPVMADMLEAGVIGDMVLAAVLANDLYIFSHPGLKPVVDARSTAINESFARWAQYRKDHGI
jgi:short-subunit dehydrogenase